MKGVPATMWGLLAQICAFLLPLTILIFILGFKLGRRHLLKVQSEMRALELAFNQLLEQMEAVSDNNLAVMENMSQEVRDLLQVTDQKCLYAHDLLQELERSCKDVKHVITAMPAIPPGIKGFDNRYIQEIRDTTGVLAERLERFEQNVGKIETELRFLSLMRATGSQSESCKSTPATTSLTTSQAQVVVSPTPVPATTPTTTLATPAITPAPPAMPTAVMKTMPATASQRPVAIPPPAENMASTPAISTTSTMPTPTTTPTTPIVPSSPTHVSRRNSERLDQAAPTDKKLVLAPAGPSGIKMMPALSTTDTEIVGLDSMSTELFGPSSIGDNTEASSISIIDRIRQQRITDLAPPDPAAVPTPGSKFHEVLQYFEAGVAIPQIAKRLKMTKGEVDLIVNMHGQRISSMRKVM